MTLLDSFKNNYMKNFLLLKNILRILYALDLTFISFAKQIPLCETFAISTIFSVSIALLQLISASFALQLLIRKDVMILKVCLSFENPLFHSSKMLFTFLFFPMQIDTLIIKDYDRFFFEISLPFLFVKSERFFPFFLHF